MAVFVRAQNNDFAVGTGFFNRLTQLVATWNERAAYRRELAELSFRDIQDIGIDQAEVVREVNKPFWVA